MIHLAKTDSKDLLRDLNSKALINKDVNTLLAYKNAKKHSQRLETLEEKVELIDKKLTSIVDLLEKIIHKE